MLLQAWWQASLPAGLGGDEPIDGAMKRQAGMPATTLLGPDSTLILFWQRPTPVEGELREFACNVRSLRDHVSRFLRVGGEIVEFGTRSVGIDEQLPVIAAHRDVRTLIRTVAERLIVAPVFP